MTSASHLVTRCRLPFSSWFFHSSAACVVQAMITLQTNLIHPTCIVAVVLVAVILERLYTDEVGWKSMHQSNAASRECAIHVDAEAVRVV